MGVTCCSEPAGSPRGGEGSILKVDPAVEVAVKDDVAAWRASRDQAAVDTALAELKRVAATDENVMLATIATTHGSPIVAVGSGLWDRAAFIVLVGCCASLTTLVLDALPPLTAAMRQGGSR